MDFMGVHRLQWRTDIVHRSYITYCVQGLVFYLLIWIILDKSKEKWLGLFCIGKLGWWGKDFPLCLSESSTSLLGRYIQVRQKVDQLAMTPPLVQRSTSRFLRIF